MDFFESLLSKMGFTLGGRALSLALCKWLGCSGVLSLAIGFAVRAFLATEAAPAPGNMMSPTGSDSGANFDKEVTSPSSGNWRQYINLSEEKEGDSAPEPSTPRHQPTSDHTVDQPVQTQPPAAGPSEPRRDPSPAPVESPPSLSLSDQEILRQFLSEEGAAVEQQEQPGAPEAMPQAPAPAEDPDLIKTSIIQRMGEFYPTDPWDPENPLIREQLFPGGKGKSKIRPMTVEELIHIHDHVSRDGKKAYWAKELHRRIQNWDWQNPRGPS